MNVKHQSNIREMTVDGETSTVIYYGSRDEMKALYRGHKINETSEDGRLKNLRLYQASGDIWEVELRRENCHGTSAEAPDDSYGKKSARLQVSMTSIPLETLPNYQARWNHNLYVASTIASPIAPTAILEAKTLVIPERYRELWCWGKSVSDCPVRDDGRGWILCFGMTKPGVDKFEKAVYSVTESARFGSAELAGRMVVGRAGKIGSPSKTFGITGGDWRCDDASVSWHGKYWLATLTWTHCGDDQGWDKDLYGDSTPSGDNNE